MIFAFPLAQAARLGVLITPLNVFSPHPVNLRIKCQMASTVMKNRYTPNLLLLLLYIDRN